MIIIITEVLKIPRLQEAWDKVREDFAYFRLCEKPPNNAAEAVLHQVVPSSYKNSDVYFHPHVRSRFHGSLIVVPIFRIR